MNGCGHVVQWGYVIENEVLKLPSHVEEYAGYAKTIGSLEAVKIVKWDKWRRRIKGRHGASVRLRGSPR